MSEQTSWGQEVEWPIVKTTFGHGSYGYECEICRVSDWGGPIVHKPGCAETAEAVRKLREEEAKTLVGAMNELNAALSECWRVISLEVERVAKKINDALERRR